MKQSLLSKWLFNRYGPILMKITLRCSTLERELASIASCFLDKFKFHIGDGLLLSLFYDPRCNGLSLFEILDKNCFTLLLYSHDPTLRLLLHNKSWFLLLTKLFDATTSGSIGSNH